MALGLRRQSRPRGLGADRVAVMSDRSAAQVTVWDCPEVNRDAALEAIRDHGLQFEYMADGPGLSLVLGHPYVDDEVSLGLCDSLGPVLDARS